MTVSCEDSEAITVSLHHEGEKVGACDDYCWELHLTFDQDQCRYEENRVGKRNEETEAHDYQIAEFVVS